MFPDNLIDSVGNTATVKLQLSELFGLHLYAKLEMENPTGSIKDRAASYILKKLLDSKTITSRTTIIESTSGNFGVSLAAYCKFYNLPCICVIDKKINPQNESLITSFGAQTIKITQPDEHNNYLRQRIAKVHELKNSIADCYWINQYENPLNAEAYYQTLGREICDENKTLDYIFLAVSSGGTITGVSQRIKEKFNKIQVIAVDVAGSTIFSSDVQKRHIPGIGSCIRPKILQNALIDDVVLVDEASSIKKCHELLRNHAICIGGSSGSVMAAIEAYFSKNSSHKNLKVLTVFPDKGDSYAHTIYNAQWCTDTYNIETRDL